jgi:hypothetical protein
MEKNSNSEQWYTSQPVLTVIVLQKIGKIRPRRSKNGFLPHFPQKPRRRRNKLTGFGLLAAVCAGCPAIVMGYFQNFSFGRTPTIINNIAYPAIYGNSLSSKLFNF